MRTATKPRRCIPIYFAVVHDRRGTSCPFADTEREQVEAFCANFNYLNPGRRAKVEVSRYRLPAAKGGAV